MPAPASWRKLLTDLLLGGFWGAFLATLAKGAQMGWQARDDGWGWLSIPVGILCAPIYALMDVALLFTPVQQELLVLDWTALGSLIGAALGMLPGEGLLALGSEINKDKQ